MAQMDTNHLYGSERKLVLIRIWEKRNINKYCTIWTFYNQCVLKIVIQKF